MNAAGDSGDESYGDIKKGGTLTADKNLWVLGNYSRFVRPGAVRYNISSGQEEDPYGLMVSAFRNKDGSWVIVAINYGQKEKVFSFAVGKQKNKWQPYRTSDEEGETLKPLAPCKGSTKLPPRSITTFVSLKP